MLALLSSAVLLAALDGPFADLDFESALARAKAEQRLLLVDFRADWCGPCRKMEKETWTDAGVLAWLETNALAIQVDVDRQPELAQRFGIEGIPAVVALKEGEEFDRSIGFKDPAGFLAWLGNVAAGKRSIDVLLERAKALADSTDVDARYELATDLLAAGKHEEALVHYLWLWPATREVPGMAGVRLSFMLSDMAGLAEKHAPARQAFLGILENLQKRVDEPGLPDFQDWQEWTSLCENFGGGARVLAWYEARRDAAGRLWPDLQGEFPVSHFVSDVFGALMDAGRAREAVALYGDARARVDQLVAGFEERRAAEESLGLEDEIRESVARSTRQGLIRDLSRLHAGLLAAGRREEAEHAARRLLETLDSPESRIALVRASVDLGIGSEESFGRWLDEAEQAGGKVRALRKRLAKLAQEPADAER
jgi:thiol-disulfide isomerase/thioredoxin